jgi:hypothetical protein
MSFMSILHCPTNRNSRTGKSRNNPTGAWALCSSFPVLCRLLALLMALVAAPTVVFAQEGDHDQSKANDPTGAWLVKSSGGDVGPEVAVLVTYHKDGTAAADVQGDVTGFPDPIFSSPEHGVWKKTGAKTFTATFVSLLYNRDNSLFGYVKVRLNAVLSQFGDQYDGAAIDTITDPNGNVLFSGQAPMNHGVRIVVEPL